MICLHCHATTDNGLARCQLCQRKVTTICDVLPIYFKNLARWRPPARPNGSLGTSGTWLIRRGDSEGSRIGHALERCSNDLTTWARALADDRGIDVPDAESEAATVTLLCDWLAAHLTSIATLEWAGQFVTDIDRHERTLRGLTETAVPGWYAGSCRRRLAMETPEDDGRCGAPTYVVPGLTWVTCGACGSTTYARDHLDVVLTEARGWVASPKELANVIVALVDNETSVPRLHDRIRKWQSLGWLESVRKLDPDGDPIGPKRYRLGDVLDLISGHADAPTRAKQSRKSA